MNAAKVLTCAGLTLGAFVASVVIGQTLSDESIMLLAGLACGILAAVPVVIALFVALARERSYSAPEPRPVTRTETPAPRAAHWTVTTPPHPQLTAPRIGENTDQTARVNR